MKICGIYIAGMAGLSVLVLILAVELVIVVKKYRRCWKNMQTMQERGGLTEEEKQRSFRGDIRRAFTNREFQLYLQFSVDAKQGKIVGGEVLSRWSHPEFGLLSSGQFIPLMEREKLIDQLDYYYLDKTCSFLEYLGNMGMHEFFIACNVSRETISGERFVRVCRDIITRYQFSYDHLVMELTESADFEDQELVNRNIEEIKNLGVNIALDDFGHGFSGLFDIQKYPLDVLKLDKKLIDNLGTKEGNVIVKGMVEIGHQLDIKVLAEGVEKEDQAELLRQMDCDMIQGFHFHYPVPEAEAKERLLEEREAEERKMEKFS